MIFIRANEFWLELRSVCLLGNYVVCEVLETAVPVEFFELLGARQSGLRLMKQTLQESSRAIVSGWSISLLVSKRRIIYLMASNGCRLLQSALKCIAMLFTQLAFILPFFLFYPIFQFSVLISEFVKQFFVHLQNTSKFACLSHQLFIQLLTHFTLFPLLLNLCVQYCRLLLHFINKVLLMPERIL
jgi:hypothetical protein